MKSLLLRVGYFLILGLVVVSQSCKPKFWYIADYQGNYILINEQYQNYFDSVQHPTLKIIEPYRQKLEAEMGRTIGYASQTMKKMQPESSLGNWFGDMLHRQAERVSGLEIDFAFMNYGGIRLPELSAGDITVGKIFELMPFDNYLVVIEMPGSEVIKLMEAIGSKKGGWPVSSQIKATYYSDGKLKQLLIHGQECNKDKTYKVASSNFLADGGDKLDFLVSLKRIDYTVWIRDLMISDIEMFTQEGKQVWADIDGRMIFEKE